MPVKLVCPKPGARPCWPWPMRCAASKSAAPSAARSSSSRPNSRRGSSRATGPRPGRNPAHGQDPGRSRRRRSRGPGAGNHTVGMQPCFVEFSQTEPRRHARRRRNPPRALAGGDSLDGGKPGPQPCRLCHPGQP